MCGYLLRTGAISAVLASQQTHMDVVRTKDAISRFTFVVLA